MSMNMFINTSILFLALITTACSQIASNQVEPSSIYGELSLNLSEGTSIANVSATFFVGGPTGTVVQMVSPSTITINGQAATQVDDPIFGTSYQSSVSTNAAIVYTDSNGTPYTNTLLMPGSLSLTLPSAVVSKSSGFTLSYTGTSGFVSGEQLIITLNGGGSSNVIDAALVTGSTSGTEIISPSAFTNIPVGTLTVSICRRSNPSPQAPYPQGTSIIIQSCSSGTTVNLE